MDNIHRFKDDPDWGRFLHRFWSDDLSIPDRKYVNERDWRTHKLTLPDNIFDLNYAFACAVNAERCSIHGVQFRRHVKNTLPLVETDHEPPTHTVIIEANIHATGTSGKKITRSMRHRIIQSCGDSGLRRGRSTCIDRGCTHKIIRHRTILFPAIFEKNRVFAVRSSFAGPPFFILADARSEPPSTIIKPWPLLYV